MQKEVLTFVPLLVVERSRNQKRGYILTDANLKLNDIDFSFEIALNKTGFGTKVVID